VSQLDKNGHDHPIHFANRQLISIEKIILWSNKKVLKLFSILINFAITC
jgi:hypothetical protein